MCLGQIFPVLKTAGAEEPVSLPRVPQHAQAILLSHDNELTFTAVTGPTHSIGRGLIEETRSLAGRSRLRFTVVNRAVAPHCLVARPCGRSFALGSPM